MSTIHKETDRTECLTQINQINVTRIVLKQQVVIIDLNNNKQLFRRLLKFVINRSQL